MSEAAILNKPRVTVRAVARRYGLAVMEYKWIATLLWLSSIVGMVSLLIIPIYYKQFFDTLSAAATPDSATAALLMHAVLWVLFWHCVAWVAYRIAVFSAVHLDSQVARDLRNDAFAYLLDHSYAFFSNHFTGSLVQKVNRYVNSYGRIIDRLNWDLLPIFVKIFGMTIALSVFNPGLAFMVFGVGVAIMCLQAGGAFWKIRYDIEKAERDSELTGALADAITNHTTIQSFSGGFFEIARFKEVNIRLFKIQRLTWTIDNIIEAMLVLMIVLGEFSLFYFGVQFWLTGFISVGTFVLAQTYFLQLTNSLWSFGRVVRDLYQSVADAKEMVQILETPHEITDVTNAASIAVTHGAIEFQDATFYYHELRQVIDHLNLSVKPGERVALVGPSGAGKSTVVKLLFRFYDLASGRILIDGQDISTVTQQSLRKNVSLVPQDPILFHRTLMENIRYGCPDATDEEVYRAAQMAHCHEFISSLPQGYETYVGERGIKLSGGERQRVAIARAMLKNAPILVLDEATSSLDSESEMLIQDALDTLMKGRTTIVIAHRLSTIRKMDRIIVMQDGKILEEGSHDALIRKRTGLYKKLWKLQAGGFIPEEFSSLAKKEEPEYARE